MGNRSSLGTRKELIPPVTKRPLEPIEKYYTIENRPLGKGHYAIVYQGHENKTGRGVAVKRIRKSATDEKRLRSEISILRQVTKHQNIVELLDVFETPVELFLVMELCTGGELFERLANKGPYSEADCIKHITDLTRAVHFLHRKGIVHRDLKPENILLSTPDDETAVLKVADFGLAKVVHGSSMKTKCGTWGYSAPEMMTGSGTTFGYDAKVDAWSVGTILYILLSGYHPFDPDGTSSNNEMMKAIKECRFDFNDEAWRGISDNAKDLVRSLLVLDPESRYGMEEILQHPWINSLETASRGPLSPLIHKELGRFWSLSKLRNADP